MFSSVAFPAGHPRPVVPEAYCEVLGQPQENDGSFVDVVCSGPPFGGFEAGKPAPALALPREIEAVQSHHLGPGGDEVSEERFLSVVGCVVLRDRTQL